MQCKLYHYYINIKCYYDRLRQSLRVDVGHWVKAKDSQRFNIGYLKRKMENMRWTYYRPRNTGKKVALFTGIY